MPTADEFRFELRVQMRAAELLGYPSVDINAGQLHRKLGIYPKPNHQMPTCCNVMEAEMRGGDAIIASPPKGRGASLTIRYNLPRERTRTR